MNTIIEKPNRRLETIRNIRINGYDIDAMGIVSNIVYVQYLEDIRMDFLDKYYPYEEMMESGISPILMHTEVDYKYPLTICDKPVGKGWVTRMEKMRWEFNFEIVSGDKVHATAVQSGSFFDMNRKRPTLVPKRLHDSWNA